MATRVPSQFFPWFASLTVAFIQDGRAVFSLSTGYLYLSRRPLRLLYQMTEEAQSHEIFLRW